VVFYSQDVRCGGCGTRMRVIGDGRDPACARTAFVVTCPNCRRDVDCRAPRPIVPRSVEVVWFRDQ
jgi:hypothetical protein